MNDWEELTPSALTYAEPLVANANQPVMSGPQPAGSPTESPNQVAGDMILKPGANIILDGGSVRDDGRGTSFDISEFVGIQSRGPGISLASLKTSAYETAPIQWYSEGSFEEVVVTASYPSSPKDHFYSDAFKQNITGDLTVTAVEDLGDSWKITFTGATLTDGYQLGNLIQPDWSTPWVKYAVITRNGTNWVEVLKTGLHTNPVATNTFSIHGIYANTIRTYQNVYALWFTAGANVGAEAYIGWGASAPGVDRTTGLVNLYPGTVMTNNIAAGDRLKAWDVRVLFDYGWNNGRVILAPSERDPDGMTLYLGAGGSHPGKQWTQIIMRALNGIDICPSYNANDQLVRIVSGYPGYRAHGEVTLGNLRVRDGALIIKDGITAPAAEAGFMKFYVDTVDGNLKVIFGDGQIETLTAENYPAANYCEIITY